MRVANLVRQGHDDGAPPSKILVGVEAITGPAADRPPMLHPPSGAVNPEIYRESALQTLAWQIGMMRKSQGDERTVHMLMNWGDARLPQFRKL